LTFYIHTITTGTQQHVWRTFLSLHAPTRATTCLLHFAPFFFCVLVPSSLFGCPVADGWCWFVLREEYCWLVAGGWFVVREKYCWLVADKPSEQSFQRQFVLCC
jgi:hypothetical protein